MNVKCTNRQNTLSIINGMTKKTFKNLLKKNVLIDFSLRITFSFLSSQGNITSDAYPLHNSLFKY